ncbi:MAG TPA: hypothetical protein VMS89_03910 [Methanoregulaceae archaeon]|nr:hypothetical protein [Methanoregulaceae archaeon]
MKRTTTLGIVIIGLIVTAVIAMPVAAAPKATGVHAHQNSFNASNLDPALKNDLRDLHTQERLARFDLNVKRGTDMIALLGKYQYDTSSLSGILSNITGYRQTLENALNAKDKNALSLVNKELTGLWRDFGRTLGSLLKTSAR